MCRWRAALGLAGLIGVLVQGACGQSMDSPLPDLSTKSAMPAGARPPLSTAEQKRAIDEMIAKRDSQSQSK